MTVPQIVLVVLAILLAVTLAVAANWIPRPPWLGVRHVVIVVIVLGLATAGVAVAQHYIDGNGDSGSATATSTQSSAKSPKSDPRPTTTAPPASSTTTTTTARATTTTPGAVAQSKQFLADLDTSGSSPSTGTTNVNGTTYPHSIYGRIGGCQTDVAYTYDLGRKWSQFTSVVGLRDGGDTRSVVQFEVYADDSLVYSSGSLPVGQSPTVTVPVAGVLNLKVRYLFVEGNMGLCSNAGYAVWGDAALAK
ncbi:NPCBM/NEW2 domain-containing protein [Nocardia asteroides]|uniref:NPCBM/NEW2 domain-containing protein n=1 Tax=Nocardia asteroides TaxID=1824 RepID=UPI001E310E2A|nr:NPCBM/NEW2 domain-containing protein [Nocardia asteroides]UGT63591.1 NPCBM/NEW2 domain-containing protein [Nocardia asteroides]